VGTDDVLSVISPLRGRHIVGLGAGDHCVCHSVFGLIQHEDGELHGVNRVLLGVLGVAFGLFDVMVSVTLVQPGPQGGELLVNRRPGVVPSAGQEAAGCSTRASTREAMNRAVRTGVPRRVTSVTSTAPRPWLISTRRPALVAVIS
jgi:hypothetical protein